MLARVAASLPLPAVHIIGFFNYYTRLADALGVDPEPGMPPPP